MFLGTQTSLNGVYETCLSAGSMFDHQVVLHAYKT